MIGALWSWATGLPFWSTPLWEEVGCFERTALAVGSLPIPTLPFQALLD